MTEVFRPYPDAIPRILFAAGGTGGHIYPAIAIAEAILELSPRAAVEFAGTQHRMEWKIVPKSGFAIHPVTAAGIERKLTLRNLLIPLKLLRGFLESRRLLKGFDPHIVVGTGGFVAGPVLWTAARMKKPVIIQEQNAYAGVTNKLLAKHADRIHIAFENAKRYFPSQKCVLSGNPTRSNLQAVDRDMARVELGIPDEEQVLFVFGGSLGSEAINAAVAESVDQILADNKTHLIWQTGLRYYERYAETLSGRPRVRILEYVDQMDLMYAAADLVISRAGAITCSELMVTGTPSVLVPSPNVAEDHQTKNAQAMEQAGAAVLLSEAALRDQLISTIKKLLGDQHGREMMRASALGLARPDAARRIAQDVLGFAYERLSDSEKDVSGQNRQTL